MSPFTPGVIYEDLGEYRRKVADAAGLLLINALAGNSHFVLIVVADAEHPNTGGLKLSSSVVDPRDVSMILDEAAQAARKELTDEDPDHDQRG